MRSDSPNITQVQKYLKFTIILDFSKENKATVLKSVRLDKMSLQSYTKIDISIND